jgi:hypothetical protein
LRAFDANGDGSQDLMIGLYAVNGGLSLTIGNVVETERNNLIAAADPVTTFPALVTGNMKGPDKDVFALPARAMSEGTRIRLLPAATSDMKLEALDASGNVLASSQNSGNGVMEQMDLAAGSTSVYIRVQTQSPGIGAGFYRLEIDLLPL